MNRAKFLDNIYTLLDVCDYEGSDVFDSPMEENDVRNKLYEIRDILN